jgi:hypothetical protein
VLSGANEGSHDSADDATDRSVCNYGHRSEFAPLFVAASGSRRSERGARDKSHEKSDSSAAPDMAMTSRARAHSTDLLLVPETGRRVKTSRACVSPRR